MACSASYFFIVEEGNYYVGVGDLKCLKNLYYCGSDFDLLCNNLFYIALNTSIGFTSDG